MSTPFTPPWYARNRMQSSVQAVPGTMGYHLSPRLVLRHPAHSRSEGKSGREGKLVNWATLNLTPVRRFGANTNREACVVLRWNNPSLPQILCIKEPGFSTRTISAVDPGEGESRKTILFLEMNSQDSKNRSVMEHIEEGHGDIARGSQEQQGKTEDRPKERNGFVLIPQPSDDLDDPLVSFNFSHCSQ